MAISGAWGGRPGGKGITLTPLHHALLGVAALLVIGAVVAGAVNFFGDPRAAGPRKTLSLSASPDTSAARVSVTEAAIDPAQAASEDPSLTEPDPSLAGAPDPAAEGDPDAPARPRWPASPLPKAPLAGYFQQGPTGPHAIARLRPSVLGGRRQAQDRHGGRRPGLQRARHAVRHRRVAA